MGVTSGNATSRVSRRRPLQWLASGVGVIVVGGAVGAELVDHGVLPGKQFLDQIDGACSVAAPALEFAPLGPATSGMFFSRARQRRVGYTLAYPPGRGPGDQLALVVMLHGFGGTHLDAFADLTPAQAAAMRFGVPGTPSSNGTPSPQTPTAIVTVDGGPGYWNPHPGDDPMAMVVEELIPMCQGRGLGGARHGVGVMGFSMGGYGALAMAERYPGHFRAAAAISPAIWTSFEQARAANAGAFASPESFAANDVIAHASRLAHTPREWPSASTTPSTPTSGNSSICPRRRGLESRSCRRAVTRVRSSCPKNRRRWNFSPPISNRKIRGAPARHSILPWFKVD